MTNDQCKNLLRTYMIDEGHYNYNTIMQVVKQAYELGFDEGYEEHKWLVQKTGAAENWGPDV